MWVVSTGMARLVSAAQGSGSPTLPDGSSRNPVGWFIQALAVTTNQADASLNLRAGINLLIRDLMATGRGIPTGGLPIPTGANSIDLNRPSPPGLNYNFDSYSNTVLNAVTTGAGLGPTINNQATDMVTVLAL